MRKKPASILFAHYGIDWIVGSERCLLDLVTHLDRSRFRPVVVCNAPTLATAARKEGAVVYSGSQFEPADRFWPPRQLTALGRELLDSERIDLIHCNSFEPVKWLLPGARSRAIPIALHVHLPSTESERCYSWAHQVASVVGVSESAVRGFRDDGLRADRIRVIYNAVDPQRLGAGDASAVRDLLGLDSRTVVIATLGSLIDRKGVDTVLHAAADLRRRGCRDFRIVSIGDGPAMPRLQALAESLQVADAVSFLGRRSDAGAVLRDVVDVVVTAAKQEAFPLNVLEAGYFGLPVVASDIPPHEESIIDGVTGFLVPVDNPSAFAGALARLIGDPSLRRLLGDAARDRIRRDFIIDRYVNAFSGLYDELLSQPRWNFGWLGANSWPPVYTRWLRRAVRSRVLPRSTAPVRA